MPVSPVTALQRWIARSLKQDPPRAKSLVMTVFGDAITPYGGSAWLGSLIALLAPLGISERLVRTAVFRLVEEGWLEASRSGRRSQYRLSAQAEQRFLRALQRVYAPVTQAWDGQWTLVLADTGALGRSERLALKKALAWEGYGELAPGVLARPGGDEDALADVLLRLSVQGKVAVMRASDAGLPVTASLRSALPACWPLDEMRRAWRQFQRMHQPLREALAGLAPPAAIDAADAFSVRTLLIHAYRRAQLHDPQLPLVLLGDDWPAEAAYQLCRDVYGKVARAAERHITRTLAAEEDEAPVLAQGFAQRFS
jgi:phenylacetic acid degradation operon negative regulatory protein